MLRFVWDTSHYLKSICPMSKVYKVLGLGWTKLGYYVFWLLWFIFLGVLLYNILGEELFDLGNKRTMKILIGPAGDGTRFKEAGYKTI